jgi:aspartate ammonia-lyase
MALRSRLFRRTRDSKSIHRPVSVQRREETDMTNDTRMEKDPLGTLAVPSDALYGIQTLRAIQNFPISGIRPLWPFVRSQIWIKKAAALTHRETGRLDAQTADAIIRAADEALDRKHDAHFLVDPYQAGAGTSLNMNVNEVLANRANELLGGKRGDYKPVHPNDHEHGAVHERLILTYIRLPCSRSCCAGNGVRDSDAFAEKGKELTTRRRAARTCRTRCRSDLARVHRVRRFHRSRPASRARGSRLPRR